MASRGKWAQHRAKYEAYLEANNIRSVYQLKPAHFLALYQLTGQEADPYNMANFLTNFLVKQWGDDVLPLNGRRKGEWIKGLVNEATALVTDDGKADARQVRGSENTPKPHAMSSNTQGVGQAVEAENQTLMDVDSEGQHHQDSEEQHIVPSDSEPDADLRQHALSTHAEKLAQMEKDLEHARQRIAHRREKMTQQFHQRDSQQDARQLELNRMEEILQHRQGQQEAREKELNQQLEDTRGGGGGGGKGQQDLNALEKVLREREREQKARQEELDQWEETLEQREGEQEVRQEDLNALNDSLLKQKREQVTRQDELNQLNDSLHLKLQRHHQNARHDEELDKLQSSSSSTTTIQQRRLHAHHHDDTHNPTTSQTLLTLTLPESFTPPALHHWSTTIQSPSASRRDRTTYINTCKTYCKRVDTEDLEGSLKEVVEAVEQGKIVPALRVLRQVVGKLVGACE